MPFAWVGIVVHPNGRAEGCAAIRAANEHHIGGAPAGRLNACQHVNVIVGGGPGMVPREHTLPIECPWIDAAANQVPAHVNGSYLVKHRCLVPKLRIARTRASKIEPFATHVETAVAIHIKRSEYGLVRNIDWRLPCDSGVGRTVE